MSIRLQVLDPVVTCHQSLVQWLMCCFNYLIIYPSKCGVIFINIDLACLFWQGLICFVKPASVNIFSHISQGKFLLLSWFFLWSVKFIFLKMFYGTIHMKILNLNVNTFHDLSNVLSHEMFLGIWHMDISPHHESLYAFLDYF